MVTVISVKHAAAFYSGMAVEWLYVWRSFECVFLCLSLCFKSMLLSCLLIFFLLYWCQRSIPGCSLVSVINKWLWIATLCELHHTFISIAAILLNNMIVWLLHIFGNMLPYTTAKNKLFQSCPLCIQWVAGTVEALLLSFSDSRNVSTQHWSSCLSSPSSRYKCCVSWVRIPVESCLLWCTTPDPLLFLFI